jgi:beta-glucosidase
MSRPYGRRLSAVTAVLAVLAAGGGGALVSTSASADGPALGHHTLVSDPSGSNLAVCPWMNTALSASERAHLLISHSTLDQVTRWLMEKSANNPTQTVFTTFGQNPVTYPAQVPCTPTVNYTDGPDYVRGAAGSTVFPTQISLASSWNPHLAFLKGQAEAVEAFRTGRNVILGPAIGGDRTPLDGRTPEYFSEDPLLSGDLATGQIDGIQNDGNPDEPVMAVLKHYIAYEQELDRNLLSSNVDGRTLQEVYNLPFAIAIKQSNPGGVMCSLQQVNGFYSCANPIMKNMLVGEDGFKGYTVSDFFANPDFVTSFNAGLDQELVAPRFFTLANINAAIDDGEVTEQQVDQAAFLVVRSYIRAGLFDHLMPTTPATDESTPAHQSLSLKIAEQGSVLLKNSGSILPLTADDQSIAVIGQTASDAGANGVNDQTVCNEAGSDGSSSPCQTISAPLAAIAARAAKDGATVTYDDGSNTASAAAVAAAAKVAIVFAYTNEGEGADAPNLSLYGNGDALVSAVSAANPNTIVVLETGSAVTMPWLPSVRGVMEAWYPGQQGGSAIASLLYGDTNFSGRLPITFPVSQSDLPEQTPAQYPGVFANGSTVRAQGDTSIRQVSFSEGLKVGYRWYESQNIQPAFPFGFGLSYTTFQDGGLSVQTSGHGVNEKIMVSFKVTNTGQRVGTDTPQVYLTLPSSTGEPGNRLVAFGKLELKPGQSQTVSYTIDASSPQHPLSYWDTNSHGWLIAPGTYTVSVNSDAETSLLSSQFSE